MTTRCQINAQQNSLSQLCLQIIFKCLFRAPTRIIPIYLVHRPSNDIPYATLEEELMGDFVKYSVKDGKEINLMRRDSEAGQKCCAFQHWVYHKTEGNLLVTDMQGWRKHETIFEMCAKCFYHLLKWKYGV